MRVAVVCKDALLRDGLLSLLAHEGAFSVAGGAESVGEIGQMAEGVAVIVVVADNLSADDWLQLKQARTWGDLKIVLVVSSATSTVGQSLADIVVRRSEGSGVLIQSARRFVGPAVEVKAPTAAAGAVQERPSIYGAPRGLTRRELEVAQLVAQGMPNRRIASVLQLQEQSIKNLVSSVMRKLDCENRVQVALRLSGRPSHRGA
jgi:DNA-binding NarL/FixJ family response regulator